MSTYLAADFGGGSGRIMAGTLTEGKLKLEEVYRFANRQIKLGNCVYWDFLSLFEEMKNGLRVAARKGYEVKSMAIDTCTISGSGTGCLPRPHLPEYVRKKCPIYQKFRLWSHRK